MRTLRNLALLALLLPAAATAAAENRLVRLAIALEGEDAVVEVEGTEPPTFTTSSRDGRLVIDFNAAIAGVPSTTKGTGPVRQITAQPFGATARLSLELESGAEADLHAKGNRLVVRVARGLPVAMLGGGEGARRAAEEREKLGRSAAEQRAKAEAEARAKLEAEQRAKAEAERRAELEAEQRARLEAEQLAKLERERAARLEQERVAKLEAEKAARLEQERVAKLEAEKLAKLEQERLARLEAERLAKVERERVAKLEAERATKLEQERVAKLDEERRAEAARQEKLEADRRAEAARVAQLEAEERAKAERVAKLAAEERAKLEAERLERVDAERRAEAARAEAAARQAKLEAERLAKLDEERRAEVARAEAAARQAKLDEERRALTAKDKVVASVTAAPGGPQEITHIGFRPTPTGARVVIRTVGTPRYAVEERGGLLVIELPQARIPVANYRRPIDASFFGTQVGLVRPVEDKKSGAVRVEIGLRTQGAYALSANGSELVLEFGK